MGKNKERKIFRGTHKTTRNGSGTYGETNRQIILVKEFCKGCTISIPSNVGFPGCENEVNTRSLVYAGDCTTTHVLNNAPENCLKKQKNQT